MSNPDKLRSDILAKLTQVSRDLSLFEAPTAEQRRAKERFWSPFMQGDTPVPHPIDLATALRYGGDSRIRQWWGLPGFIDWFTNQQEFRERIEFIAHLALDGIEEVLRDRMATGSAKVAAAKLALEVANKLPRAGKAAEEFADGKIAEMNKQELEQFIQKKLLLLPGNKQLTSPPAPDTVDGDTGVPGK